MALPARASSHEGTNGIESIRPGKATLATFFSGARSGNFSFGAALKRVAEQHEEELRLAAPVLAKQNQLLTEENRRLSKELSELREQDWSRIPTLPNMPVPLQNDNVACPLLCAPDLNLGGCGSGNRGERALAGPVPNLDVSSSRLRVTAQSESPSPSHCTVSPKLETPGDLRVRVVSAVDGLNTAPCPASGDDGTLHLRVGSHEFSTAAQPFKSNGVQEFPHEFTFPAVFSDSKLELEVRSSGSEPITVLRAEMQVSTFPPGRWERHVKSWPDVLEMPTGNVSLDVLWSPKGFTEKHSVAFAGKKALVVTSHALPEAIFSDEKVYHSSEGRTYSSEPSRRRVPACIDTSPTHAKLDNTLHYCQTNLDRIDAVVCEMEEEVNISQKKRFLNLFGFSDCDDVVHGHEVWIVMRKKVHNFSLDRAENVVRELRRIEEADMMNPFMRGMSSTRSKRSARRKRTIEPPGPGGGSTPVGSPASLSSPESRAVFEDRGTGVPFLVFLKWMLHPSLMKLALPCLEDEMKVVKNAFLAQGYEELVGKVARPDRATTTLHFIKPKSERVLKYVNMVVSLAVLLSFGLARRELGRRAKLSWLAWTRDFTYLCVCG